MTPTTFTFKLTVPRDPALVSMVADVAAHAVTYAEMDRVAGGELVDEVSAISAVELTAANGPNCVIVVACVDGELRVTIGGRTVSRKFSA